MSYLRRLPRFEYLAPHTVDEACDFLAAHGRNVGLLAGGTDLLLQMRRREATPGYVIGLKNVAALAGVRAQADGGLAIGAMTTLQELLTSPIVRRSHALLSEIAALIGGPELRNAATVGGNVAGGLPCADFPSALMTLGARLKLASRHGERTIAIKDFYPEFGKTAAAGDELLAEISLPAPPPCSGGAYLKFHDRHSMDMTTVGVSAFVTCDESRGVFREVKIALASSAPVIMRARRAEAALRGQPLSEEALAEAAAIACEESAPRSSWRATREFRLQLVNTLTRRAVRRAWEKALATSGAQA
jgi:carbon-monoxide dehydrogenase medium subunit